VKERYNNGIAVSPHAIIFSSSQVLFIINDHPSAHKDNNNNILILKFNGLDLFLLFPKAMNTISKRTIIKKNNAGKQKFNISEYIYIIYKKE
jgi:hypothetical protein